MALGALKRPDFSQTLCPEGMGPKEREARTEELRALLETTGLKSKDEAHAETAA
jgi:hypothetical protein